MARLASLLVVGAAALPALGCAGATTAGSPPATTPRAVFVPARAEPATTDDGSRTALAFAEAQVGKTYCSGGSGPRCFDCSGLVQAAWRAAGVRLPRTTDAQGAALPAVPPGEARPGDIFWWRHGHVGLYLGNGLLVDAYHSGAGVVVRRAPVPDRVLRVAAPTRLARAL